MKSILTVVLFLGLAAVSFGQDINGTWKGTIMDQFEVAYTFKADGEKLTGSTTGPDGNVIEFKDGKINGNAIEFILPIMDQEIKMVGELKGDVINIKFNMMGNDVELLLKKEKK